MWRRQPGWTGVGVGGGEGKVLFQKGAKGRVKYSFGRKSFGGGEMIVGRKTVQRGSELLGIGVEVAGEGRKSCGIKTRSTCTQRLLSRNTIDTTRS